MAHRESFSTKNSKVASMNSASFKVPNSLSHGRDRNGSNAPLPPNLANAPSINAFDLTKFGEEIFDPDSCKIHLFKSYFYS